MDFVNATKVKAGWTMGFDRDGRELLIVVAKATYTLDRSGQSPQLADEQVPLTEADVATGEPGYSATLYESDYAHRKPKCDVLLNGSAYAPSGKPVNKVTVSLTVGPVKKSFDVVGNRTWRKNLAGIYATPPEPFTVMPISYDNAYGGVDRAKEDPATFRWYPTNHAGKGYHEYTESRFIDGKPLPNTEETRHPVNDPRDSCRPMALGAIGRAWQQRAKYVGTYDQKWLDEQAPFWPRDFDYLYFQAAAEDQRVPYLVGGEEVVLTNLTPVGVTRFQVPTMLMPIVLIPATGSEQEVIPVIDTLLIEPDQRRFMLTWRASVPMKRSVFDMVKTIVGEPLRSVRRRRAHGGKKRYVNLDEMIKASRARVKK